MVMHGLEVGFQLDRLWHSLRGEMQTSKRPPFEALGLEAGTRYAIIGGIAMQVYSEDPRTTLDIDLAIDRIDAIPRDRLERAAFHAAGRFPPADNWLGPEGVPIQFTEDPALGPALGRATALDLGGVPLRVITPADLLHEKLRAGADPVRRRSKRLQDLADAQRLLEGRPELSSKLDSAERATLERPA